MLQQSVLITGANLNQAPDSHWHYACPLQPFLLEKPLQKCGLGSSLSVEVTSTLASYTTRDSKFCCVGIFSALLVTEIHHLGFHKFPNPHHPSGLIGCGLDVNHERLHIAHYQPPKLLHVPQTRVLTSLLYIMLWFVVLSEEPSWAGTAPCAIKQGGRRWNLDFLEAAPESTDGLWEQHLPLSPILCYLFSTVQSLLVEASWDLEISITCHCTCAQINYMLWF